MQNNTVHGLVYFPNKISHWNWNYVYVACVSKKNEEWFHVSESLSFLLHFYRATFCKFKVHYLSQILLNATCNSTFFFLKKWNSVAQIYLWLTTTLSGCEEGRLPTFKMSRDTDTTTYNRAPSCSQMYVLQMERRTKLFERSHIRGILNAFPSSIIYQSTTTNRTLV